MNRCPTKVTLQAKTKTEEICSAQNQLAMTSQKCEKASGRKAVILLELQLEQQKELVLLRQQELQRMQTCEYLQDPPFLMPAAIPGCSCCWVLAWLYLEFDAQEILREMSYQYDHRFGKKVNCGWIWEERCMAGWMFWAIPSCLTASLNAFLGPENENVDTVQAALHCVLRKNSHFDATGVGYVLYTSQVGVFCRRFAIPELVELDQITAKFESHWPYFWSALPISYRILHSFACLFM